MLLIARFYKYVPLILLLHYETLSYFISQSILRRIGMEVSLDYCRRYEFSLVTIQD